MLRHASATVSQHRHAASLRVGRPHRHRDARC